MAPQDHNKTLGIVYTIIGVLALTALSVVIIQQIRKSSHTRLNTPETTGQFGGSVPGMEKTVGDSIYFLPLPMFQLLTAYGLFRRKRWGRLLALIFSTLYVWIVPLGTALAVYTWWFLHSEGGKRLYAKSAV